jgi:opacity protein-like surface antigen
MNHTRNRAKFFTITSALLGSLLICAFQTANATPSGFLVSAFAGVSDLSLDHGDLVLSPFETDKLDGNQNNSEFTPAIGFAYNFMLVPDDVREGYLLQSISVGMNLYYFQTDLKGDVLQFGDPIFNNYSYKMDVTSGRLMIDSEWNFKRLWGGVVIFGQAGIGYARNTVKYQDTPKPGIPGGGLTLSSQSQDNFAYDLGVGLKYPITMNSEISLRYLYTGLGSTDTATEGELADGSSVTLLKPVSVDLTSQSLLLGFSYYFG